MNWGVYIYIFDIYGVYMEFMKMLSVRLSELLSNITFTKYEL